VPSRSNLRHAFPMRRLRPLRCIHAAGGLKLAERMDMAGMDSTHNLESLPDSLAIKTVAQPLSRFHFMDTYLPAPASFSIPLSMGLQIGRPQPFVTNEPGKAVKVVAVSSRN